MTFYGYKRPDGRVGVRNHVLILPASVCASDTTRIIAQQVTGAVTFNNQQGCSQVAPDQQFTMDVMAGYAANPNIYGTVVVSLGCENCQMDLVVKAIEERTNKPLKQVIIQDLREAESGMVYEEYNSKQHEILTGVVTRIDPRNGSVALRIGTGAEATDAILTAGEQVKGETLVEGQRIKVYLVDVRRQSRGPQVVISRTHPGLVKRLFELEVPEIYDGTVEIRSIAREAGSRTKMAVWSNDANVDPIGACVGPRGQRVNNIVEELRGEKIDIIKYSDDPAEYIAAALAPADVVEVRMAEDGSKACRVIVPDDQLSLAIGKEGQNARLAARLVGYKIDIKPKSYKDEE